MERDTPHSSQETKVLTASPAALALAAAAYAEWRSKGWVARNLYPSPSVHRTLSVAAPSAINVAVMLT